MADGKRAKALEVQTAVLGHLKVAQAAPEHIGGGQWQTAGEIATRLGRPRSSVSSALNALKLEHLVEWRSAAGKSWLEYRAAPVMPEPVPDARPEREVLVTPREELMGIIRASLAEQLAGLRPALEKLVAEIVLENVTTLLGLAAGWKTERSQIMRELIELRQREGQTRARLRLALDNIPEGDKPEQGAGGSSGASQGWSIGTGGVGGSSGGGGGGAGGR